MDYIGTKTITKENIVSQLFYFHSQAHFLHLQTTSYSEHKTLDNLYKELVEFKDDISEKILGYEGGRLASLANPQFFPYDPKASVKLCDMIMTFALSLESFAERKNYRHLANIAQSLHGLGAETKYLLTLK